MSDVCPQCGDKFKSLGNHWAQSSECDYPELSEYQKEIATGLLMGDGNLNIYGANPWLQVQMISPDYLRFVDSEFGILGTGVSLSKTAQEAVEEILDSGFLEEASVEDYSDLYWWQSRCLPSLRTFERWYETGEKVYPEDIDLTPTVMKHWYCGDGNFKDRKYSGSIRIGISNESENTDKLDKILENAGLPTPTYIESEYEDGSTWMVADFSVDASKELWEYMGEPPPDFEYKWPEEYRKV